MDYHSQLTNMGVMEVLKFYTQDFLVSDKEELEGYKGEFVLAVRESGTWMIKLDLKEICWGKESLLKLNEMFEAMMKCFPNKLFFHGKDGAVKMVDEEKICSLFQGFLKQAEKAKKHLLDNNYDTIAFFLSQKDYSSVKALTPSHYEQLAAKCIDCKNETDYLNLSAYTLLGA